MKRLTTITVGLLAIAIAACGGEDEEATTTTSVAPESREVPDEPFGVFSDFEEVGVEIKSGPIGLGGSAGKGGAVGDLANSQAIGDNIVISIHESSYLRNSEQRYADERNPEYDYTGCSTIMVEVRPAKTSGTKSSFSAQEIEDALNELYAC